MYTQLWNKYLPIIRILMKRSAAQDQLLDMNTTDFERAGAGRKASYKFSILFSNGRADNLINSSPVVAKEFVAALLEDGAAKELIIQNDYRMELNTKCQLGIKFIPKPLVPGNEMEVAT